ncbi:MULTISPECIES: amino acid adenylation domain-containing protein [unclassified Streptomyces]|uniref:amino acid adenylation domain-containing protein n=1 Tax=unclassified Streptomyces TaxID=2593676 RepID=UPI0036E91BE7
MKFDAGNVEDVYALTPLQQGMLFHCLLEPDAGLYVTQQLLVIRGQVDVASVERAWDAIVARHATLRTSFEWEGLAQPVQVVWREVDYTLDLRDLRDLPPQAQEKEIEAYLAADLEGFRDLPAAPLFRGMLFQLADDVVRSAWSFHQLLLDGWSVQKILGELSSAYVDVRAGRAVSLPPAPQYRSYLEWLETRTKSGGAEEFWKRTLARYQPASILGSAGRPQHTGASRRITVDAADYQALRRFAGDCRVTLNTVVSAAWGLLTGAYSGTRDVVFGASVADRPAELPDAAGIAGVLLRTVPVRVRADGDQTVRAWLQALQLQQAEAREYGDATLTDIQKWAGVERGSALFDTMLAFENFPLARENANSGFDIEDIEFRTKANYPLALVVVADEELLLTLRYSAELFDADAVDLLATRLGEALRAVTADPDRPLDEVDVLTSAERRRLAVDWNDTQQELPGARTLVELFEARVAAAPDTEAAVCGDERLTYAQLDARANQLARHLRELGVRSDDVVALCLPRGIAAVVATLAVLKAGGAYTPLDTAYPPARLGFLLRDTDARVLVTESGLTDHLPPHGARTVCVDADAEIIAGHPESDLDTRPRPENLAYVIYTSGSTGAPKGVEIPHSGIVNYVTWWAELTKGRGAGGVSHYSPAFDTTVRDTFCPLVSGETLHVLPEQVPSVFREVQRRTGGQRLSYLKVTPSELASAAEGLTADDLARSTAVLLVGGEAVTATPLLDTVIASPDIALALHYGPTEASVGCTYTWIDDRAVFDGGVPIGRPIPNMRMYVLDPGMRMVPVGMPGELYIGGVGLARGYRGRPGLTAQRFRPDPFGAAPGARLYRTGDLVRHRPDGMLEFLGRLDHQVKLRGHRIEPGEVEAVLARHPDVAGTAVLLREDTPGAQRLVAYVVPDGDRLDVTEVRAYAKAELPAHMVPSVVMRIDSLPLTPGRKIDRSRLPRPDDTRANSGTGFVGPRDAVEELVAGVWSELLGVEDVGAFDDFFELGGHSLLVTRAVSRLRDVSGVEVPFGVLFEVSTVAGVAEVVSDLRRGGGGEVLPAVEARTGGAVVPLSFAQQRMWFVHQLIPGNPFYNLPAAYRIRGPLDVPSLTTALSGVVARHEVLRSVFTVDENGTPVSKVHPPNPNDLPVVQVAGGSEVERVAEATRLVGETASQMFDLERGPVVRAALLRLGAEDHVLVVVLHHMVADGWSAAVLNRELGTLYTASRDAGPDPLSALPVQYGDYAVWQRQVFGEQQLAGQLAYWQTALADVEPVLELPADRARPAVSTYRGGVRVFVVPRDLTDELRELARTERATLFMVLLGAFDVLLARYTGRSDVVVGTPVANRRRAELENLIGFFINTLALRVDCSGEPSFHELLGRVRTATLGAYAHQDVPFERVVNELGIPRDLSRNPLVQVGFQLQNMPRVPLRIPDASTTLFLTDRLTTHLDMEVYLSEIPLDARLPTETEWGAVGVPQDQIQGGLLGQIVYSTDLFDASSVDQLIAHFRTVLRAVVADPQRAVHDIDVLTDAERRRQIVEWNDTRLEHTDTTTVTRMFEDRAAAAPEAEALVCGGERLTYAQLNARANQLARHLSELGAGPEVVVAVCLPRGITATVAILAVLKSGGAYAPMDPEHPVARLAHTLRDNRAHILICEQSLGDVLPPDTPHTVWLDTEAEAIGSHQDTNLTTSSGPDDLAYLISTSGSTGTPKNVEVPHRGLTNLVRAQGRLFGVATTTRSANAFGPAFDAAVSATLLPLTHGGTLCLQPAGEFRYGDDLARHLRAHDISTLHIPVSVLKTVPEGDFPALRAIGTGTEAVTQGLVSRWSGSTRLFNAYGPTETTVVSVMGRCTPEMADRRSVPIGRPIDNTTCYVLDPDMRLVPAGVPGELYIGGVGVSRGYRGRPGLTAQRFRPDPFGAAPGARLYRTGDLVRHRPDGMLEFLGRLDHQVKLRGHRVELGEIEVVLARHPDVADAAVLLSEDAPGGRRLVGYVVASGGRLDVAHVRDFLKAELPGYMVPSVLVQVDAIPLTGNGKVDRDRLPELKGVRPDLTTGYVAPQGAVQEAVAAIWGELLGLDRVGAGDDFFELGGHSLLMVRMIWLIRQRLHVELLFADVFEAPTVAELAEIIQDDLAAAGEPSPEQPEQPDGQEGPEGPGEQ